MKKHLSDDVWLQEIDKTNIEEMTKKWIYAMKQKCFEVSESDAAYNDALVNFVKLI